MTPHLETAPTPARTKTRAIVTDHSPATRPVAELHGGLDAVRAGLLVGSVGLAMWTGIFWLIFS